MKVSILHKIVIVAVVVMLAAPASAVVLKIATLSPDGSFWMQKLREGAKEIDDKTENRVRFKFYPGGVMGNDKAVLRKIRIGQLHGGAVTGGSLANVYGDIRVYSLLMVFKSTQQVDYVRERMDVPIISGLEKAGFVTFGLAEGGFAYIMSKEPIKTTDDLRTRKLWMPDDNLTTIETMQTFGIKSIPLPVADVRAGLQTGLIDTVTISPIAAIVLQWHTQLRYLTQIPVAYVFGLLAVDRKAFEKISAADRQIVQDVMGRVFRDIDRRNRKDNIAALEVLRKNGIKIFKPTEDSIKDWLGLASAVNGRLVESGELSQDILNVLEKHLNEYRSRGLNANE
jgi:TRAP-type C4-dicarboxylate transport system substrate-binding protein